MSKQKETVDIAKGNQQSIVNDGKYTIIPTCSFCKRYNNHFYWMLWFNNLKQHFATN